MSMRLSRWSGRFCFRGGLALMAVCLAAGTTSVAQDDPTARFKAAGAFMALDSVDKPWHLQLSVTLYDDKGKHPATGTIEVWQTGHDSRQLFTFGASSFTRLQHGGETSTQGDINAMPYWAEEALQQVLHPGATEAELAGGQPLLQSHTTAEETLDCMMLIQRDLHVAQLPVGLYPTFCLEPGGEALRTTYRYGNRAVIFHSAEKFEDHEVATKVDVMVGATVVATATTTALATYTPDPHQFLPSGPMKRGTTSAKLTGDDVARTLLKKVAPQYPESARANHISGAVVFDATIGRDGHVYALDPVSSPDPDLTIAALAAARQWIYKPYSLNGANTDVDTTITVDFHLK